MIATGAIPGPSRTQGIGVLAVNRWGLVLINTLVFAAFAFSFSKPSTARDWRSFSAFSAFIVALLVEIYGLSPTIYLLSGWLQYDGFVLIRFGFLLQWPTILTLAMFPMLVWMYVKLAKTEERDSERPFGQAWRDYAAHTPRFFPRLGTAKSARPGDKPLISRA